MKINSISNNNPLFPDIYRNIPDGPTNIWYMGNLSLEEKIVAIVGTRKATTYGKETTTKLTEGLAKRGVLVVSGLALGIDSIAHRSALAVGGRTFAILPCGIDNIYPSSHHSLANQILDNDGAILTEYKPGTPAQAHRFLERNRLVSGLADTLIVTEAAIRSGTMNTVYHALSQGKEVYAVPGNIYSPMSAGCNKLIEKGATPIINIETFLEDYAPIKKEPEQALLFAKNQEEQTIINLLVSGITDGDEIQQKSGLDASTFSTTLTMLEINDVIRPTGANHWSLK